MSASLQLRRTVALLSLAVAAVAAGGAGVSGQTGTALRISPPNFEITAEPGQVVAQQIRVSNRGDSPIPITMQIAGFRPQGQEGQVELTEEEEAEFGILTWTTVSPSEFVLEPGAEEAVTFLIEVPDNAPPGGHYMSILAKLGSSGGQGLAVGQRIGSLVLLRVAGEVVEQAQLADFAAPSFAAKGPIDFDVVLRNTGNVHLRPVGEVVITGTFGGEVAKLPLEQRNILPESERVFSATWETGWNLGRYTAEYTGIYGSSSTNLKGSTTVILFPWPIILPIAVVLGLLAFMVVRARARIARSFRVLAGRD